MTTKDFEFYVSFDITEDTELMVLKRVIGQVAASVGARIAGQFAEECAVDWERRLAAQPLPIFSFGEAYKDSLLWRATGNCSSEHQRFFLWNTFDYFNVFYRHSIDSIGVFEDFDRNEIPRGFLPAEEISGFALGTNQFLFFRKESNDPNDGPVPGQLVMESGVPAYLLNFNDSDPFIFTGLDRFWVMVVQDVIVQLHRRLRSRRTVIWDQTEGDLFKALATLDSPDKLTLWDFGLLSTGPFGVEKIDQALNRYEEDLRRDRLRESVIQYFESTTVR